MNQSANSHTPPRILVIDDKPTIREIIERRLSEENYRVEDAEGGREGLSLYKDYEPDLILLDTKMPEMEGRTVLSKIREDHDRTEMPVIMLSHRTKSEAIAEALENGANDFIQKPIDFDVALARIETHLELRRSQLKIRKLARRDDLTGLLNRRVFVNKVEEEMQRAERYEADFSVVMIDLDYFKEINDEYGHLTGDEVLKEFADLLKNKTRQVDVTGRYGGEEFCILLPRTDLDEAFDLAERLRELVKEKDFSKGISLTCSLGLAGYDNDNKTVEELLDQADQALYISKREGRDQTTIKY